MRPDITVADVEDIASEAALAEREALRDKFREFARTQQDIPSEYVEIVNRNFWDLL